MLVMLLKNDSSGFGVAVADDAVPVQPFIRPVRSADKSPIPMDEDIPLTGMDPVPDIYCPAPEDNWLVSDGICPVDGTWPEPEDSGTACVVWPDCIT